MGQSLGDLVDARRQPVTGDHAIGKEDHPIGV
jgi:hypothetical protein